MDNDIEAIVGIQRHSTVHYGRAVSATDQFYILHSRRCLRDFPDSMDCPFSFSMLHGINRKEWAKWQDMALPIGIRRGMVVPFRGRWYAD